MIRSFIQSILFWSIFIGLLFLAGSQLVFLFPHSWSRMVYGISGTFCAFLATWILLKSEKKVFKDVGLIWDINTITRFFKGILIGAAIFALVVFALVTFSELQFKRNDEVMSGWSLVGYLAIVPLALMEEVAFRSYPFVKLNKAYGLWAAQFIGAVAFALYHVIGGQGVAGSFLGPGIWAFVFGLSALWSGGIAMPTGIHIVLNTLQNLTGMKPGNGSVWVLGYKEGTSESLMAKTDTVGLIMQFIILAGALALTAFFNRKINRIKNQGDQV